jgi:16S rRNA (uracil1498-N3)-methyltransferase
MTRRRWIADEISGDTAALTGEHALHLSRVLRAQVNQEFDIATGGAVRRGTITSISDSRVEFALGEEQPIPAIAHITLALAIFKFDRMEWAIEKCTELGVARIIPIVAQRTDSHLAHASGKRRERWQRLALQASEQSRRAAPPEISAPVALKNLGSVGSESSLATPAISKIVLAESENDMRVRDILSFRFAEIALAIGPEGGWSSDELRWFRDSGWTAASLGNTILRAETAAIVATAFAMDAVR